MEKEKDTQNELTQGPSDNGGGYGVGSQSATEKKNLLWIVPVAVLVGLIIWALS